MFLESFNQGLIMHEMGGFDRDKAREVFNIPDDYEVGIMIAIGYQDSHKYYLKDIEKKQIVRGKENLYQKLLFLKN